MESLYEIDQLISKCHLNNNDDYDDDAGYQTIGETKVNCNDNTCTSFSNNVIDPYIQPLSTTTSSSSSISPHKRDEINYRERIAIMELSCIDKQIERNETTLVADNKHEEKQDILMTTSTATTSTTTPTSRNQIHSTKHKNHNHNDLHSDLYETDIEMDFQKYTKNNINEIQSLIDLYNVDQQIQQSHYSNLFENEYENDIFKSFVGMDNQVDTNSRSSSAVMDYDFIDPITELIMREYGFLNTPKTNQKCWNVKDILDLLMTDKFIDGNSCDKMMMNNDDEKKMMDDLYHVDCEVDYKTKSIQDEKEFHRIIDLYHVDQEIDVLGNNKKVVPIETNKCTKKKQIMTKKKEMMKTKTLHIRGLDTLPKQIAELYLTDLDVEGLTQTIDEEASLDLILELYNVDCEVDRSKFMSHRDQTHDLIFKDLYHVDQLVDHKIKNKDIGDKVIFEDKINSAVLQQYNRQSNDVSKKYGTLADVFDLLLTDLEVHEHNSYNDALEDIEPLLKVDLEMNSAAVLGQSKDTMKGILDLMKVDMEIEVMRSSQQTMKHLTKPAATTKTEKQQTKAKNEADHDMDVIMHLYEVDQEVTHAKYESFFNYKDASIFNDLWMMDMKVDKMIVKGNEQFEDPFTKSLLNQYSEQSKAVSSHFDRGVCEVLDLICIDMNIGAAISHKKAVMFEGDIIKLYQVDLEIEKMKRESETKTKERRGKREKEVSQNFSVTMTVCHDSDGKMISDDTSSCNKEQSVESNQVVPRKRSIFSTREKNAAAKAGIYIQTTSRKSRS